MHTLTIKVDDDKVMKLLEDLEALHLIRVIKKSASKNGEKLSEKLAGSITQEQAFEMQKELKQMRNEWTRDI